jgi:peroxiredoxin
MHTRIAFIDIALLSLFAALNSSPKPPGEATPQEQTNATPPGASDADDVKSLGGSEADGDAPSDAQQPVEGDAPEYGTLAEELDALRAESAADAETYKPFEDEIAALSESEMLSSELKAAPMFTLQDQNGHEIVLGRYGPQDKIVVLQFYRGEWCPYCNAQLRWLNSIYADFQAAGAEIIAISPESAEHTKALAERLGLSFPIVSDPGSTVAKRYNVAYEVSPAVLDSLKGFGVDLHSRHADEVAWLPLAATFAIDTQGTIFWRWIEADYRERAEPQDVLSAVQAERQRIDAEKTAAEGGA